MMRRLRVALPCLLVMALGACANAPVARDSAPDTTRCMTAFAADDTRLAAAGIHDAQAARVAGHPYLRVDRLLASFTAEAKSPAQRSAWLARAAALDAEGRALEHARLPGANKDQGELDTCRRTLLASTANDDAAWASVAAAATVPDDYSNWRRALGAYPLTSLGVMRGVRRMQERERPTQMDVTQADAVTSDIYTLVDAQDSPLAVTPPSSWPRDALGIPILSDTTRNALLRQHAPQLAVVRASHDDLPGTVMSAQPPTLDIEKATLYTHLTYTRFEQRVLPQLVYTWWFAARSAAGLIDPLAGTLDGLSWRVTLDDDGAALAYDVMHNCGCYHMFFPGTRLQARGAESHDTEPQWIPFTVPDEWHGALRLLLASGSHFVTALAPATDARQTRPYVLAPYDALRSLPVGARRVSLFDAHGLVPGTTRGERWFLWPMGVVAPGSMRQWGHHATAFVGRRHFDDAALLARYFARTVSSAGASKAAAAD